MKPIVVLAFGCLVVSTVCGCAASSTKPGTRADGTSDAERPPIIERQTPPHYRPIPQGTYEGAEQAQPSDTGSAQVDSSRARGRQGSLEPPLLYDVPGAQEPASSPEERAKEKGEGEE